MAWIESHQTLRAHPKLTVLAERLKITRAEAIGHLHMLWWWCIDYADDGILDRYSYEQIAVAGDFSENLRESIEALIEAGFIDSEPLRVHDWLDFCGDLIKKRLEYRKLKRRRSKRLRESLRKSENSQPTVTVTIPAVPDQPNTLTPPPGGFESLWLRYPRREGRKAAERHYNASVKTPQDWLDIQNALENYLAKLTREKTEPRFIMKGDTWFNNWRDWVNYNGVSKSGVVSDDYYAKLAEQRRKEMEATSASHGS